jgi:hypothetical protein
MPCNIATTGDCHNVRKMGDSVQTDAQSPTASPVSRTTDALKQVDIHKISSHHLAVNDLVTC